MHDSCSGGCIPSNLYFLIFAEPRSLTPYSSTLDSALRTPRSARRTFVDWRESTVNSQQYSGQQEHSCETDDEPARILPQTGEMVLRPPT